MGVNGLPCSKRSDRHAKLLLHEQELNARCPKSGGLRRRDDRPWLSLFGLHDSERKVYERAHIEIQLAHVPNKEVEVPYNNALYERNVAS